MNNFSYTHKSHPTNTDQQARNTLWILFFLTLLLIGLAFYVSTWYGTTTPESTLNPPLPDVTTTTPAPAPSP